MSRSPLKCFLVLLLLCGSARAGAPLDPTLVEKAEKGDAVAQMELYNAYAYASGVYSDYAVAAKWLRLAAEQGHLPAIRMLGSNYGRGFTVKQDNIEAAKWYRLAALQGDEGDLHRLGMLFATGNGVPQDRVQADVWWSIGDALGLGMAADGRRILEKEMTAEQIAEAAKLAQETVDTIEKNTGRKIILAAVQWVTPLPKATEEFSEEQKEVGKTLRFGEFANLAAAIKAADEGNANAQNAIGQQLHKMDRDSHALVWFLKAAEQGNADAQFNYASYGGAAAKQWLLKSAEQGHVLAQDALGLEFAKINGEFKFDLAEAMKWSLKAAAQGEFAALGSLGIAYKYGNDGLPQDSVQSWVCCKIELSLRGDKIPKRRRRNLESSLKMLEGQMSAGQLAEATRQGQELLAQIGRKD